MVGCAACMSEGERVTSDVQFAECQSKEVSDTAKLYGFGASVECKAVQVKAATLRL